MQASLAQTYYLICGHEATDAQWVVRQVAD